MEERSDEPGLGRRDVLTRLGSVVAVGFLNGCGGGDESSPTSASSSTTTSSTSAASTNAQCVATPALTEGPYFVDEMLNLVPLAASGGGYAGTIYVGVRV